MELYGKAALVTGAGSGIGRASALALAREGAQVLIVDVSQVGLDDTSKVIRAAGGSVEQVIADVTDRDSVDHAVRQAVSLFGRLDIAHNNAGVVGAYVEFAELSQEEATRIMNVNFWGVFHCLQAEIRQMLVQGGGTIVNTASAAGMLAVPGLVAYCASKHAVVGLTKTAAAEYAARGIRINAVCPGLIETPMTVATTSSKEANRAMLAMHPIGRFGTPEEVAEAVVWLASARCGFLVGASLLVDGGYSLV